MAQVYVDSQVCMDDIGWHVHVLACARHVHGMCMAGG